MKIQRVELASFRGLKHANLLLDPNFNVLIGVNGIGKTSVLDAIAVLLSRVLPRTTPAKTGYRRFQSSDLRSGSPALTARLRLQFGDLPLEYGMTESFGPVRTLTEDRARRRFRPIIEFYDSRNEDSTIGVPIALYYTTDRAAFRLLRKSLKAAPAGRAAAYHGALRDKTVNYRSFVTWLRTRQALAEERPQDRRILEVVQSALSRFLPVFARLEGQENPPRLFVSKRGVRLGIEQLSDGERSFVGVIIDLARHLAHANPGADDPLSDGEGVILIDELELHLHPKWQRSVVQHLQKTFPSLQFITTTHSPFVVQSLKPGQLIDLDPEAFAAEYSDKSIEDISEQVMGVNLPQKSERYQQMMAAAETYFRLLRTATPQTQTELEGLKRELDALAEPFSDDPAYMALLRVERETWLGGRGLNAPGI